MNRLCVRGRLFSVVICLALLMGCSLVRWNVTKINVPALADPDPIYELPTISLAEKEAVLFDATKTRHLNEQGYLLYQSYLPLSDLGNYQLSHSPADLPAWHGHWMAALAMKLAVAPSPEVESLLHQAVEGLRTNFEATGVTGLLGRSYLKYAGDTRLPWMLTEEQSPTRFWQKGENGFWYRNGVAKGHYSGSVFGLATVIGLENRGAISLDPATHTLVRQTLVEIAHYLIDTHYRIVEANGKVTEFGRLNDWRRNGFSGLQLLAMLRVGKAIGDKKCTQEYDRLVASGAGPVIGTTLGGLGNFYAEKGRYILGHFSDDQATYTEAFTLFFNSTEEDKNVLRELRYGLGKMWQYLRYARNSYVTFIHHIMVGASEDERGQAIQTLKMFPDDKHLISNLRAQETESVQPIANQDINSHYWKTNYFRKAILTNASERMNVENSSQDYLFVYWMGRYFDLISEEEAIAPVTWR